ncbi:MAG TPA: YlmC/YmxH family sporulation protein [Candidatus Coprosoma intestinipullorum]|uniref:YlmC/YmxH family sporulation protein n=1 Tax=Candidatus Coprosoma intestinipullorum TaxID=2840752 RepID=A0A9D0ZR66_9FIRM|nr:YlmC/YmxH family sporulation protein [Candidatus Coprosoma intestinipullorum]
MMLSDLQNKDIINVFDGKKVGVIIDVNIDKDGKITEISVQRRKFLFFSAGVVKIKWDMISKIGKDVILVNVKG